MENSRCVVGTAGWSIPAAYKTSFPSAGSQLERYAMRLSNVEINSSFHKPHRRETYESWARSVPDHFRFSAKLPRAVTHERRLEACDDLLDIFLGQIGGLGAKLSVLLIQLPPSLQFEAQTAENFFASLRAKTDRRLVCEPRHPSWFEPEAEALLSRVQVGRVAADPAPVPAAAMPGGWREIAYFRFHGAPRIYYSDYEADQLLEIGGRLAQASASAAEVWCIFDNTARGHALGNALSVDAAVRQMTFSSLNALPSATRS
ncbi:MULTISPECIES: DUF72 domain-containing protein [unclassified Mesorhizobium]|uniref:DUF72 domain-containing protein n=1 Tax=unclassified Mesorhizobium TaxID=325217 RepID=UPI000F74C35A|nr:MULTISPECIES: DUF72 domain-containing protein [unclassified Mesorhizobium]AZO04169.1 DUF72 domain-containing protein [Mesorhizobium sp. M2A.F.Ca.ET.043.02.1.1]RUW35588.1 DUF72 domain-containing protein [Mesorhizobium sp. M2A.F.Ca.ET.015.02.1.1]RUW80299.1 DUF72 domain-containing protein [Mesorhizobium sp. M2A.F.Ca.ET.067.02.1.1]RVC93339.1 DUF72 domain-containing protein [Mesorhizobium sp. M2A.F.Ca.ET.017.03.2.1]RVC99208.1 DUF72 domain-containing protein [Mesorhizobium sp. M2A.F.Ca.ET.029.05.